MTAEIWIPLLILNKFLVYLGMAAAIGGGVSLLLFTQRDVATHRQPIVKQWHDCICKLALFFIVIAFIANIADFFVQTGNMSESGLSGMLEPIMLEMIWVSSTGTLTVVRGVFLVFSAFLLLTFLRVAYPRSSRNKWIVYACCFALMSLGLSYSFTFSGHTSDLDFGSEALITLHVAIAFSWLGSLIPLVTATSLFNAKELYTLMTRFAFFAVWLVALLLASGLGMIIQLVSSTDELISSTYGQFFIIKISFVLLMLGFAVWHKFELVPRLVKGDSAQIRLRRSIIKESAIGLLVLLSTSILTTAYGPVY